MTRLPSVDDSSAIFKFAMEFDGYERFGSVRRSAQEASAKRRASLEDLLNELFFAARASRYGGDDDYVALYQELLPLLREHLK